MNTGETQKKFCLAHTVQALAILLYTKIIPCRVEKQRNTVHIYSNTVGTKIMCACICIYIYTQVNKGTIKVLQMNKGERVLNFLATSLTHLPFWDFNYVQVVSRCSRLDYLHWAHLLME